jgi:hypothetical protein
MENSVKKWEILGIPFLLIVGALWHFFYDWTGNIYVLGWFWPVNESIWEHLKMTIFPILIWLLIEYRSIKGQGKNIFFAKAVEIVYAIILIPVVYYIYFHFTNHFILAIDIGSYYFALITGQFIAAKIMNTNKENRTLNLSGIIIIILLIVLFVIFTYMAPHIALFQDNHSLGYGILHDQ